MNSAGPILAISNSTALGFFGAARVNDVTQTPVLFGPVATTSGRFFLSYDSLSGDIVYGVNTTPGSAAPSHTSTFSGLGNSWNGDDLLASFFLRSDEFIIPPLFNFPSLSSGTVTAVFSNFEVLSGTPVAVASLLPPPWE